MNIALSRKVNLIKIYIHGSINTFQEKIKFKEYIYDLKIIFHLKNVEILAGIVSKVKRLSFQSRKTLYYKKKGILVLKKANNENKLQFIRIATISLPSELPYKEFNNNDRIKDETQLNKFRDELNDSSISRKRYNKKVNKIRDNIPIRFPLTTGKNLKQWMRKWRINNESEEVSNSLDNLIDQGVEVQLLVFKKKKKDNYQSLIILVEYGPLFPLTYDKKRVMNRPSVLDTHIPLKNYKRILYVNSRSKIELYKYRRNNHSQSLLLKENILFRLLHKSSTYNRSTTKNSREKALNSLGDLSRNPDNAILSITGNRASNRNSNLRYFTEVQYLNLQENKSLYVVANSNDFENLIDSYISLGHNKQDKQMLIFSKGEYLGFQKIPLDKLRLSLISLKTDLEIQKFKLIYQAMDILFGDKEEAGSSDINWFFKEMREYNNKNQTTIKTIEVFLELLADQLTNQAYLGKTKIISKIYQILRQYNLKKILDPIDDGLFSVDNIIGNTHFKTEFSSKEAYLSMYLILLKLAHTRMKNGEGMKDITLVIDDPGITRVLSNKENFTFFKNFISNLQGIRVIIHSTKLVQHSQFIGMPRLVINEKDRETKRNYSTLHLGSSTKIDVNPVNKQEVLA